MCTIWASNVGLLCQVVTSWYSTKKYYRIQYDGTVHSDGRRTDTMHQNLPCNHGNSHICPATSWQSFSFYRRSGWYTGDLPVEFQQKKMMVRMSSLWESLWKKILWVLGSCVTVRQYGMLRYGNTTQWDGWQTDAVHQNPSISPWQEHFLFFYTEMHALI